MEPARGAYAYGTWYMVYDNIWCLMRLVNKLLACSPCRAGGSFGSSGGCSVLLFPMLAVFVFVQPDVGIGEVDAK